MPAPLPARIVAVQNAVEIDAQDRFADFADSLGFLDRGVVDVSFLVCRVLWS